MLKIKRPLGRLIFNIGIAIPGKTVFLIETAPSTQARYKLHDPKKNLNMNDSYAYCEEYLYLILSSSPKIGSMTYLLLFGVRSWNNGTRCISFYIFIFNGIWILRLMYQADVYNPSHNSRSYKVKKLYCIYGFDLCLYMFGCRMSCSCYVQLSSLGIWQLFTDGAGWKYRHTTNPLHHICSFGSIGITSIGVFLAFIAPYFPRFHYYWCCLHQLQDRMWFMLVQVFSAGTYNRWIEH